MNQKLCPQCLENQDSVRMWMIHLAHYHPLPTEWLSERAKMLKDDENQKPYTVVTDSRKRRRRPTTPRPLNTFMIFSRHIRRNILSVFPDASNSQLSKELGLVWKKISPDIKAHYEEEAKRLVRLHQQEFPDYKYQPKKRCRRATDRIMFDQTSSPATIQSNGARRTASCSSSTGPIGLIRHNGVNNSPAPSTSSSTEDDHYYRQSYQEYRRNNSNQQTKENSGQSNSDIENHYIRYSILGKNIVKRECQTFGSPQKVDSMSTHHLNTTIVKKENLVNAIDVGHINSGFSSIQPFNNNIHNNNNSGIIFQPISKPLNVKITNIDTNFIIRQKLMNSSTTSQAGGGNIYLITNENNHVLVSSNQNNANYNNSSNNTSSIIHDLSCHGNNNSNNESTTEIKDMCLINSIYPEGLEEDIDITGNFFSNDLELDWTELDDSYKHDLPNLSSIFHN